MKIDEEYEWCYGKLLKNEEEEVLKAILIIQSILS